MPLYQRRTFMTNQLQATVLLLLLPAGLAAVAIGH